MRRVLTATVIAMLAGTIGLRGDDTAARWWSHVEALANDGMEGRNTGSPGAQARRRLRGRAVQDSPGSNPPARRRLHPAGRLQDAPHRRSEVESGAACGTASTEAADARRGREHQRARRSRAGGRRAARVRRLRPEHSRARTSTTSPACTSRARSSCTSRRRPKSLPGPLQAHFGSAAERWKIYKAAGAIGTVSIANPKSMDIPWARSTLARLQPSMSLADPALDDAPGQQLSITMNPAHADKLFAGSGHTFAELLALVDGDKPLPRFALPARLKATAAVERADVVSQNVAAILRGSRSRRRDEYVVFTAHLDHLGIGSRSTGTRSTTARWTTPRAIAAMLDVAASLQGKRARSRRGRCCSSRSRARRRASSARGTSPRSDRPRASIVANVNTDMFLPLFPLKMLTVSGSTNPISAPTSARDGEGGRRDRAGRSRAAPQRLHPQRPVQLHPAACRRWR